MTFRQLAANNVRGSWQRYLAYFFSCACSVLVFYVFLSFITNDAVQNGYVAGREAVNSGLLVAEVIVVIFSFLFISYSTNAFLRSRKKEFGLLTLMGMTQKQLRTMVFQESMMIAGLALVSGLVGGILFSKLFFMVIGVILGVESPIPFEIPPVALAGTAGVFLVMFLGVNVVAMLGVRQNSVRELLKAHRQPKASPKRRPLLLALGLGLLAQGYYMAWNTNARNVAMNILVVTTIVIIGTYFVLTQGGVLLCAWLKQRRQLSYRGTNLVIFNRLVFRLGDNAKILFIGAILIAVVSTSLGAFNSILQNAEVLARDMKPFALSFRGTPEFPAEVVSQVVREELEQAGANNTQYQRIVGLYASMVVPELPDRESINITLIKNSDHNRVAQMLPGFSPINLSNDEAVMMLGYYGESAAATQAVIQLAGKQLPVKFLETNEGGYLTGHFQLVVSDAAYAEFEPLVPQEARNDFHAFEYDNWENIEGIQESVQARLPNEQRVHLGPRAEAYHALLQTGALTMFIGLFVCIVFFFAAGSMIYFTELGEDRQQYRILHKIGITSAEVNRIVTQELGALFFLPLVLGAVHTGFALKALDNLVSNFSVIRAGLMIAGGYLLAQLAYFLFTRAAYTRQVLGQRDV